MSYYTDPSLTDADRLLPKDEQIKIGLRNEARRELTENGWEKEHPFFNNNSSMI